MKRIAAVLALLLLFGAVKFPMEEALTRTHRTAYFHGAQLNLPLREQIGQGAFVAALSGFRGVIADLLTLKANDAWENTRWDRVVLFYDQITTLQPRVTLHWEMAAFYMAYDAAQASLNDPNQPRQTLRVKACREYQRLGRDFLERGIRNNPDRYVLYNRLGAILMNKIGDHEAAYEAYAKAAEFPDCMGYEKRFAAYELSKCPGKEAQAYALLAKLYSEGPREHTPTLLQRLKAMEDALKIPPEQRVYNPPGPPS
ncbi:MAG: hypothetical protein PHQ12_02770 [Chthoniobacteraceae bacterium]|nr:hypothetical protein [Chthoniobacteraceae bacterium]